MASKSNKYYEDQQKRVKGIALPSRIKCITCNKSKLELRYSQKQLTEYRKNIEKHGNMTNKRPECKECKGGNREELECSFCDIVKGLEHFTAAQLRKNDQAKCKDCQQEVDDVVPDVNDALVEEEIKEEIRSGRSVGSPVRDNAPALTLQNASGLSFTGSLRSALPSISNPLSMSGSQSDGSGSAAGDQGDGVFIPRDPDPGHGHLGTARPGSNRISNANSRQRTPSIASNSTANTNRSSYTNTTSSTWADFPPDRPSYGAGGKRAVSGASQGSNNPGFAKQRAPRVDPVTKAKNQLQKEETKYREAEQNVRKADDDSDDEYEDPNSYL